MLYTFVHYSQHLRESLRFETVPTRVPLQMHILANKDKKGSA